MNHISLDGHAEALQQFLLSLATNPTGTVVELHGRAVACVLPMPTSNGSPEEEWNDAKIRRRWDLIEKKHRTGPLPPPKVLELSLLQEEMLRYRQRIPPLPLEDAERLHAELLDKARRAEDRT